MEVYMVFKNNMRPAFAGASANGQAPRSNVRNDAFMYDAGTTETDDFGTFSGGASANGSGAQGGRPHKTQKKKGSLNVGAVAIAVCAVVALILVCVLLVALIGGSKGGDIKYEKNTFISYQDSDGTWRVAANGNALRSFDGDVYLQPAADRSFAYIVESVEGLDGSESVNVYYTDGKNVEELATSATEVIALASLKPGVIWHDVDNGVMLYTEDAGEETLVRRDVDYTKDTSGSYTFKISADASTVAYNEFDEAKGVYRLCVWKDGTVNSNYQRNVFVEALSNDGSLVYVSGTKKDGFTQSLSAIPCADDNPSPVLLTDNFSYIVTMNTAGDELVVATTADATVSTSIISFNPKKLEETPEVTRILKGGVCYPISPDSSIAVFGTFADTYFKTNISLESLVTAEAPVFYVDKKFNSTKLSTYSGKFSPNGDYFYYIDKNERLKVIDLDDIDSGLTVADEVVDFEVTQKGNVYYLGDDERLVYYTVANDKAKTVASLVSDISMNVYSNTLYFTYIDGTSVYRSEESTKSEPAKIEGIVSVPYFADANAKKTFAAFWDEDNEEWKLMYTSNGKKFKSITTCEEIPGFTPPVPEAVVPQTPTGSDTTDTGEQ